MPGKVDFGAIQKTAEQDGHVPGGDIFKFKEGANRLRLLTAPLAHPSKYKGTPNFKWLCYALDREDGRIKVWFMPHTVFKAVKALSVSEDYAFDEVPMPFDITINADGAGTKEVKYSVMPARANKPLSPTEEAALAEKKPIEEVKTALDLKTQDRGDASESGGGHWDPDEIPA